MAKKSYSTEEIISRIKEVEVHTHSVLTIAEAVRKIGVTDQAYYKWRRKYGGLELIQAKRFKEIEKENTRLKRLVADLSLDNAILKEFNSGKY